MINCCVTDCLFKSDDVLELVTHELRHLKGCYPCVGSRCTTFFSSVINLRKHIEREHYRTRWFRCDHCGEEFRDPSYRSKHFNNVHPEIEKADRRKSFRDGEASDEQFKDFEARCHRKRREYMLASANRLTPHQISAAQQDIRVIINSLSPSVATLGSSSGAPRPGPASRHTRRASISPYSGQSQPGGYTPQGSSSGANTFPLSRTRSIASPEEWDGTEQSEYQPYMASTGDIFPERTSTMSWAPPSPITSTHPHPTSYNFIQPLPENHQQTTEPSNFYQLGAQFHNVNAQMLVPSISDQVNMTVFVGESSRPWLCWE